MSYFIADSQECENCDDTLYDGEVVLLHDDNLFCDELCLSEYLVTHSFAKHVELIDYKRARKERFI